MDDPREVPRPVTGLSTQWQDEDLKAQDDLLSLKVLQDPGFLHRVPTLIPGEPEHAFEPRGPSLDMRAAQDLEDPRGLSKGLGSTQNWRSPGQEVHEIQEPQEPQDLQDPPLTEDEDFSEPTPWQIQDTHLKMITQEVTQRVLEQLEEILPDLIASTLEEVLRGPEEGELNQASR